MLTKYCCLIPAQEVEAHSLYEALARVTDNRKKRGLHYKAALIMTLIVLGKLAGESSLQGIAKWARLRIERLRSALALVRATLQCANTNCCICDRIDLDEQNERPAAFFRALAEPERPSRGIEDDVLLTTCGEHHLALDGKSLRAKAGRETYHREAVQLLGLYHGIDQYVVRQVTMRGPGREQETALKLIGAVDLTGCVVSADALRTRPTWCQQILDQGGDYLLIAMRNQPTLHEDIALLSSQLPVPWLPESEARNVDKGHGRLEIRHLRTRQELGDYLETKWPAAAHVFQIKCWTTERGTTRRDATYGLTSLPMMAFSARGLPSLIRRHWHIENRVHWRRDVTLKEDAYRVREGKTPLCWRP